MTIFNKYNIPLILLTLSLPLAYAPKILAGDTQPWILIASLISILFVKNIFRLEKSFVILLFASFFSIISYYYRSESDYMMLRNLYIYVSFLVFWIVTRKYEHIFSDAIRFTVLVWFAVGLCQIVSIFLGHDLSPIGRFVPFRTGPPSITAEPSFYGSISAIHAMYLLYDERKGNNFFISLAVLSILISGSSLGLILLAPVLCVLLKKTKSVLPVCISLVILVAAFIFFVSDRMITRYATLLSSKSLLDLIEDQSINLRFGHIHFTLFHNLLNELFLQGNLNFWGQYNLFANHLQFYISTKSDYILPALGELIFSGGLFSLVIVFILFREAFNSCLGWFDKTTKLVFIFLIMLNPISISNFFLILFINQKRFKKL
jgi:hypothetical protein